MEPASEYNKDNAFASFGKILLGLLQPTQLHAITLVLTTCQRLDLAETLAQVLFDQLVCE